MRYKSVSNLWSRIAGRRAPQATVQVEEFDKMLDQALEAFRHEPVSVPPWENIERLMESRTKEQVVTPISRATVLGLSRKVAWIAAASAAVLLAFFTVPFSQSNPVGARVVFAFNPPLASGSLAEKLGNCASPPEDLMPDGQQYGITNCSVNLQKTDAGVSRIELVMLTEHGIIPDDLVRDLTGRYPDLAKAQTTITPIEERSTGSLFDNLAGTNKISLHCEGKTAEEIAAEVKAQMAAQGMPNAEVHVDKEGDSSRVKVRVCVKDTTSQK